MKAIVFECLFTEVQLKKVQADIDKRIDKKCDTVVFYTICLNCFTKITCQPDRRKPAGAIKIV